MISCHKSTLGAHEARQWACHRFTTVVCASDYSTHLSEHVVHVVHVVVVQEPHGLVLVVLVERDGEAVGHVEHALGTPVAEQRTDNAVLRAGLVHAIEVIDDAQEHERMDDHLFHGDLRGHRRHVDTRVISPVGDKTNGLRTCQEDMSTDYNE